MLKSHEIVSFPLYVWSNYKPFISEKELILLGHFQAIQTNGKSSWSEVAKRLDYDNSGAVTRMLKTLEEREIVILTGSSIDATPLYNKCLKLHQYPETKEPKKKKTKAKNEDYVFASILIKEYNIKNDINNVVRIIRQQKTDNSNIELAFYSAMLLRNKYRVKNKLEMLVSECCSLIIENNTSKEDFNDLFNFVDNRNIYFAKKYDKPKDSINTYKLFNSYKWWIEKGKPKVYESEKFKKKSFLD